MNHDSTKSSSSLEPSQSEQNELQRSALGGKELMSWTIKALPHPTLFMDVAMGLIFLLGLVGVLNGVYEDYVLDLPLKEKSVFFQTMGGVVFMVMATYMWKMAVRQKNVYRYRITNEGGEVEYHIDFPEGAGVFFTILSVVFLVFVFVLIAYNPGFIWMLAGPVGMGIVAARFFLNFEVEKHVEDFYWKQPDWIIIDEKRSLIVISRKPNPDISFEQNYLYFSAFLPKDKFSDFLQIAKEYAPKDTDFDKRRWNE